MFELTEKHGAVLGTKYCTCREDIGHEFTFEKHTKCHYDSWVTFVHNAPHGNSINPVLATGLDVSLLASASVSIRGTRHTQGLVHPNRGSQMRSPPSRDPLTRIQSISDPNNGSDSAEDSMMYSFSQLPSCDPWLESFSDVSPARQSLSPSAAGSYLPV